MKKAYLIDSGGRFITAIHLEDDAVLAPNQVSVAPPGADLRWDGSTWVEPDRFLGPDWDGLLAAFAVPGANSFYGQFFALVAQCGAATLDHWQNFKALLPDSNRRSPELLAASVQYLAYLMAQDGHPVAEELAIAWNAMMAQFKFPAECRIDA